MSLEGAVSNVCAIVVHVWHDRLVHSTVPLHVAWLSQDVSPCGLVVHVVDWSLACSPLTVCIRNWWVLRQDTGCIPVEQVGVVSQSLCVEGVVVHNQGTVRFETTANTTNNEPGAPYIGEAASGVEVADREFTNDKETETNTDLGTGRVVCPVIVGTVDWASNFFHLTAGEPRSENSEVLLSLRCPLGHAFLKSVL